MEPDEVTVREIGEIVWVAAGLGALVLVVFGFLFILELRTKVLKALRNLNSMIHLEHHERKE